MKYELLIVRTVERQEIKFYYFLLTEFEYILFKGNEA